LIGAALILGAATEAVAANALERLLAEGYTIAAVATERNNQYAYLRKEGSVFVCHIDLGYSSRGLHDAEVETCLALTGEEAGE